MDQKVHDFLANYGLLLVAVSFAILVGLTQLGWTHEAVRRIGAGLEEAISNPGSCSDGNLFHCGAERLQREAGRGHP